VRFAGVLVGAFPADKGDERWMLIALFDPADPKLILIVKNLVFNLATAHRGTDPFKVCKNTED
jgi:hypothetical protein